MVISAKNVGFSYSGSSHRSLNQVSFEIGEGEFVVLTGPSGCGKTTLCRMFNGLIPNFYSGEFQGQMIVDGLDVTQHPTSRLSEHVGLVFQNPENQLFALSAERDVAFGLENLGVPSDEIRRRVEWAMEVTGISHLKDKAPYELSGGQQQRVAIASVLAMQPRIIVLDEPTSFLDPKSASEIIAVVGDLNRKLRITVILVEHRLDLVSRHANRVLIMNNGQTVLDGKPGDVYGEEARLIGIGVPKVTRLFQLLRADKVRVSANPVTVEEAALEIRRRLKP